VLAGAVIIGLNPARQFQQARDSERWSHMTAIANAVQQNITENKGTWTCTGLTSLPTATSTMESGGAAGTVDICGCLVPNFVASMPFDPSATGAHYTSCSDYSTEYTIVKNASTGRVTISATPEVATAISVTQ